eukprot:m.75356 g.75356  ORF g.75356 m.75356 type:complete len:635 (-) comp13131_c0_seq1:37-1941(-)
MSATGGRRPAISAPIPLSASSGKPKAAAKERKLTEDVTYLPFHPKFTHGLERENRHLRLADLSLSILEEGAHASAEADDCCPHNDWLSATVWPVFERPPPPPDTYSLSTLRFTNAPLSSVPSTPLSSRSALTSTWHGASPATPINPAQAADTADLTPIVHPISLLTVTPASPPARSSVTTDSFFVSPSTSAVSPSSSPTRAPGTPRSSHASSAAPSGAASGLAGAGTPKRTSSPDPSVRSRAGSGVCEAGANTPAPSESEAAEDHPEGHSETSEFETVDALPSRATSPDAVMRALFARQPTEGLPPYLRPVITLGFDEVPQDLLPLPDNLEETNIRGDDSWAPPRPQIIFSIHKKPARATAMQAQGYRCVGCGMPVSQHLIKTFRYCDYLGKFFCASCHFLRTAVIPARVLRDWDFTPRPVCNFSLELLQSMYAQPLYSISSVNPGLYVANKELAKARESRLHLLRMRSYIASCSRVLADENMTKAVAGDDSVLNKICNILANDSDVDLYSIAELVAVRDGHYLKELKHLTIVAEKHIRACEGCRGKGFLCMVCNGPDILFPFDANVARCDKCNCVFHKSCFVAIASGSCPRCKRNERRLRVQAGREAEARLDLATIRVDPDYICGGPAFSLPT